MKSIACIVEGEGDEKAVPVLLRRIAVVLDPGMTLKVPVLRRTRGELIKDLERYVELAARRVGGQGSILILFDSDDDLPCQLGPALTARATTARSDMVSAVVLAKREFEAWFLAGVESLSGCRGLAANLTPPPNPEGIRNAKGWLCDHMGRTFKYNPPTDQAALTELFDLDLARQRSPSFDKCYREIVRILGES